MARLCERPGCSDPAAVAYGMRPADLVFWLDALRPGHDDVGVLCRRHADTMVVPRFWTLDDQRRADLPLFRPPEPDPSGVTADATPDARATTTARRPRSRPRPGDDTEQLRLGVTDEVPEDDAPGADDDTGPWTPDFDPADDLDGLLAARGPLLARAFRVAVPESAP